jgi:hypothetical protein
MVEENSSARPQTGAIVEAEPDGVKSPFCRDLRSKRYYFLQEMPTEEHHFLDASRQCWCRRTMQAIGPDGERAIPRNCKPDRGCYLSRFEEA